MDRIQILFPIIALATLTFAVLLLIPYRRFRAASRGVALIMLWTHFCRGLIQ